MPEERKVPLIQLTPMAHEAVKGAIIQACLANNVPINAALFSQYTVAPNGDLRIRTFMGDSLISEVIVEESQWSEQLVN